MAAYSILIADSSERFRAHGLNTLKNEYRVYTAQTGKETLRILEKRKIDLVLMDASLSGMSRLELAGRLVREDRDRPVVVTTARDTNPYIQYARRHRIWNLLPKSAVRDSRFLKVFVYKLLTGDIFGPEKYFPRAVRKEINPDILEGLNAPSKENRLTDNTLYSLDIPSINKTGRICEAAAEILINAGAGSVFIQVVEELVSNALYRAPAQRSCSLQDEAPLPDYDRKFKPRDRYSLSLGLLDQHAVFSITDSHGSLEREEILYRLERHVTLGEDKLPIGLNDSHGRGLFITRELLDHLIVNISPGVKTEIVAVSSLKRGKKQKAVSIHYAAKRPLYPGAAVRASGNEKS